MASAYEYPRTWEIIKANLMRLRVPGGWLVHNTTEYHHYDKQVAVSESMIFFPDQNHTWNLEPK